MGVDLFDIIIQDDKKRQRKEERPRVYIPVHSMPLPPREREEKQESDRGVTVIDILGEEE
jgi:hypothetical protein